MLSLLSSCMAIPQGIKWIKALTCPSPTVLNKLLRVTSAQFAYEGFIDTNTL